MGQAYHSSLLPGTQQRLKFRFCTFSLSQASYLDSPAPQRAGPGEKSPGMDGLTQPWREGPASTPQGSVSPVSPEVSSSPWFFSCSPYGSESLILHGPRIKFSASTRAPRVSMLSHPARISHKWLPLSPGLCPLKCSLTHRGGLVAGPGQPGLVSKAAKPTISILLGESWEPSLSPKAILPC